MRVADANTVVGGTYWDRNVQTTTAGVVQQVTTNLSVSGTTFTIGPVTIQAGNAMILIVSLASAISQTSVVSVTDANNTWAVPSGFAQNGGGNASVTVVQTTNTTTTLVNQSLTLTVTPASTGVAMLFEVAGVVTNGGPVSVTNSAVFFQSTGTATFATTAPGITPTKSDDFLLGYLGANKNSTPTPLSGVTFTQGTPLSSYPSLTTITAGPNAFQLHADQIQCANRNLEIYSGNFASNQSNYFVGILDLVHA